MIEWHKVKGHTPHINSFVTPENRWARNVDLKHPGEHDPGMFQTQVFYFKTKGKEAKDEYTYAYSTGEHSFDIPVPGAGTPEDWQNQADIAGYLNLNSKTCTPSYTDLKHAYAGRKHHPQRTVDLAKAVAQCEQRKTIYDFEPTKYEFETIAGDLASAPELKKYLPFRIGQLEQIADENGIEIPWLIAWAKGPTFLAKALNPKLKGAALIKAAAKMTQADLDVLSYHLGKEVIALALVSQAASGILWVIGRIHGDFWNDFLDAALVRHDKQVNAKFAADKAAGQGDGVQTIYRVTGTPGARTVSKRTEDAPPPRQAAVAHKRNVDATKKQHGRQTENVKRDAGEFYDSQQRARAMHLGDAVKAAIEWFVTCETAGKHYRKELSTKQIELLCMDAESIDRLNTPEIAALLHAELAEQMGVAPPPPTEEKGSPLPLILAVGGFLFGGPLGAGAGFAIGKSMEKKDASQTL